MINVYTCLFYLLWAERVEGNDFPTLCPKEWCGPDANEPVEIDDGAGGRGGARGGGGASGGAGHGAGGRASQY